MSEKLKRGAFYVTADYVSLKEAKVLGLEIPGDKWIQRRNIKARWTGEKRCPKAGEWYLSGARIAAYRAPNDLSTEYHIAELVLTETITITTTREV